MSKHIVSRVLQICGPCRILHAGASNDALLQELLLSGCDAYASGPAPYPHPRWLGPCAGIPGSAPLDAMLVDIASAVAAPFQLRSFFERFGLPKVLALRAQGLNRKAIEDQLFESSWRCHPGGMVAHEYEGLSDEVMGEVSFYERLPDAALPADRNPDKDMLRESGSRADAQIARYSLAAQFVRPGDTVLDCASGRGYGTAVLASLSNAAKLVGVELDAANVEYAQINYGREGVTFHAGDPSNLSGVPDSSIDVVVSMETVECVPDWNQALKEFHRVLKPDGRLVAGVHHDVHTFDWAQLEAGLNQYFFVEMRYAQTAPGGSKLEASRSLRPVEIDAGIDSEWMIAVACKSPLEGRGRTDFKHPSFQASLERSGAAIVDFAHYYDNPYLYRPLVQMGERIRNDVKLAKLAHWVMMNSRPDSADRGAAICVFGYQVLEKREVHLVPGILDLIREYVRVASNEEKNPHVLRWRLSLNFLAGRLCELTGDREQAAIWYRATAECDWRKFSPILATKTVGACFFEGRIRLADGDVERAKTCFSQGLKEALAALKGDLNDIVGNPEQPIPFGLPELAEVIDMGSQCANAIAYLPLWKRDPGLFWKHVDVKRFGLASWAKELERENQQLRESAR